MKKYKTPEAVTIALSSNDIMTGSVNTAYGENETSAQTWSWRKNTLDL